MRIRPTPVFGDAPGLVGGNLRISVLNVAGEAVAAGVLLDQQLILTATLPSNRRMWEEYGLMAAFQADAGKHTISVVVAGVGEVGRQEYVQGVMRTNHVTISIYQPESGGERIGCRMIVKTNASGVI